MPAVEAAIHAAVEKQYRTLPTGLSFTQYLDLARQHLSEGKYIQARDVYMHLRAIERDNPEVANGMGNVAAGMGLLDLAAQAMSFAVAAQPRSATYRANLGALLLRMSRFPEAEAYLRSSLELDPGNADVLSNLALAVSRQGRESPAID
jgi:Flp pilus assembly protein TadD